MELKFGPILLVYKSKELTRALVKGENIIVYNRAKQLLKVFEDHFGLDVLEHEITAFLCELVVDTEKINTPGYAFCYPDEFQQIKEAVTEKTTKKRGAEEQLLSNYHEELNDEMDEETETPEDTLTASAPVFVPPLAYGSVALKFKGYLTVSGVHGNALKFLDLKLSKDVDPEVFAPLVLKYGYLDQLASFYNAEDRWNKLPRYVKTFFGKEQSEYNLFPRLQREDWKFYGALKATPLILYQIGNTFFAEQAQSFLGERLVEADSYSMNRVQGHYIVPNTLYMRSKKVPSLFFIKASLDDMMIKSAYLDSFGLLNIITEKLFYSSSVLKKLCEARPDVIRKDSLTNDRSVLTFLSRISENEKLMIKANIDVPFLKEYQASKGVYLISGFNLLLKTIIENTLKEASKHPLIVMSHRSDIFNAHFLSFSETQRMLRLTPLNITDALEQVFLHILCQNDRKLRVRQELNSMRYTANYVENYVKPVRELAEIAVKGIRTKNATPGEVVVDKKLLSPEGAGSSGEELESELEL